MLKAAGAANLLEAEERPLNVYAPCWCLSGKKWKFCHKDRESKEPLPYGKILDELIKHYATGPCQHPLASHQTCSSTASISSHTIQRRGGLAAIAENGHVFSAKKGFSNLQKNDGKVDLEKIGVRQASTFPGFCNDHDTELFRPVELATSKLDFANAFLLSLRAVTYEFATKDAQLRSHVARKEFSDNGHPFEVQAAIQNFLSLHQVGIEQGLKDITSLKALYDEAFRSQDFSNFSCYGVQFDRVLPFAAAGAFIPEFDFEGGIIQEVRLNQPVSQIALNVTKLGETTSVVFGWFGGEECAAARFVNSFKTIPDRQKADSLLVLAMEYLENFFCTPSWWTGLAPEISGRLHEKIAGGMPSRSRTALVEPNLNALIAGVKERIE